MRLGDTIHCGAGDSPCRLSTMQAYRRRLPHFHPEDAYLFLTWRLSGSLPTEDSNPMGYPTRGHAFVAQDRRLDRHSTGPIWLRQPSVANLVSRAILIGDSERRFYDIRAWVVMPNHVHLLIFPLVAVPGALRWLKGSTARSANKLLGRTGQPFWQDESYDHYLRNLNQIDRTAAYIEENPVSAGLVCSADQWMWSSAGWKVGRRNVS